MGKVLLVVDDSSTIRTAVELIFEATEYRVVSKENGSAGLAWMRSHTPDLILVDERMPDMDGYDFGAKIKAVSKNEDVPILLLACHDGPDESRADDADLDGYVNKPFGSQELVTLVEMLTGSSQISQMPLSFKEQLVHRQRDRKERLERGELLEEPPVDEQLSLEAALASISDEPKKVPTSSSDDPVVHIPVIDHEPVQIAPVRLEARGVSSVKAWRAEVIAPPPAELMLPKRAPTPSPPPSRAATPRPLPVRPPQPEPPSVLMKAELKPILPARRDPDLEPTPAPHLDFTPEPDIEVTPQPLIEPIGRIPHADLEPPPRFPPPSFAPPPVERANMIETLPPLRRDLSAPRRPMPAPLVPPSPPPPLRTRPQPMEPAIHMEPAIPMETPIPMEPLRSMEPQPHRRIPEMMVNIEAPVEAPPPPSLPPPLPPPPPPPKMDFDLPVVQPGPSLINWNESDLPGEQAVTVPPRISSPSSRGLLFALLALAVVGGLVAFYFVSG